MWGAPVEWVNGSHRIWFEWSGLPNRWTSDSEIQSRSLSENRIKCVSVLLKIRKLSCLGKSNGWCSINGFQSPSKALLWLFLGSSSLPPCPFTRSKLYPFTKSSLNQSKFKKAARKEKEKECLDICNSFTITGWEDHGFMRPDSWIQLILLRSLVIFHLVT